MSREDDLICSQKAAVEVSGPVISSEGRHRARLAYHTCVIALACSEIRAQIACRV